MRKVLIADDEQINRRILSSLLSSEYDILEAVNGEEALKIIRQEYRSLSAILLDIKMPVMDGFEVLKYRQEDELLLQIPTLIVTIVDGEKERVRALELGANDFITKPYKPELIQHCLRNNIKMHELSASLSLLKFDRLTGIYNREAFLDVATAMIRKHESGYYVISCFDIENFKIINDQYGTDIGDEILKHVARCISLCIDALEGICCRITADDFALIYPAARIDCPTIAQSHQEAITPKCINRKIRIRIGRYRVDDLSIPVSAMYDRAAMANESIKGRYDIYIAEYNDSMRFNILREQQIVNDMDEALRNGEFEPWFQPQYNHTNGAMVGAEALVRWNKDGMLISPAEFLPVFERNGFIYEMDQYIWEQVCIIIRRWLDTGISPLPISVNISRRDLLHQHFTMVLTNIVHKYDIPYDLLRLEVTESAFSDSYKQIALKVEELVNLGFTVEIDDFGSGYSSLNTLKDVPASILKLDMRFLENTKNSQRSGNIIESVVRMAKWLGMTVIAEGVEERAQADYLRSIGCYYIQGYYYAKPMPLKNYEELLFVSQTESKLSCLETLETLNNNEFWNPKSMETLIFNSYVGGACIFEFHNNRAELLRVNEQYAYELGQLIHNKTSFTELSPIRFLDNENRHLLFENIHRAIATKKESSCELVLYDAEKDHKEYIRSTVRVIAIAGEHYLFYCVIINQTEQRISEQKRYEAERKEMQSAEQLQIIMKNINGGVSAVTIDDNEKINYIFTNNRYYELYGYTQEQAIAENLDIMKLIVPEDYNQVIYQIKQLKKNRNSSEIINYRIKKRDGKLAYLSVNASLMSIAGYGDDVITSVVMDITEQKELTEQLQAIINNINGGVTATVIRDDAIELIIANDKYYNMLGYTREEYYHTVFDLTAPLHPDDREYVIKQYKEYSRTKKHYTLTYRIIRKDGSVRYIANNISVINMFGVKEPVQLSVTNDMTEIREIEQKELEATDRLRAVLNHAGNGITAVVLAQNNTQFLFSNQTYFEIIGYDSDTYYKIIKNDPLAIVLDNDREDIRDILFSLPHPCKEKAIEYRVKKGDGSIVWIKTVITVTNLIGIDAPVQIAVHFDITKEKELLEKLHTINTTHIS